VETPHKLSMRFRKLQRISAIPILESMWDDLISSADFSHIQRLSLPVDLIQPPSLKGRARARPVSYSTETSVAGEDDRFRACVVPVAGTVQ